MFGDPTPNRRLTSREFEWELQDSKIWGHKPRTFLKDIPFYEFLPPTPIIPRVNFELGFKK